MIDKLFDAVLAVTWQAGIIALVIMALRPLLRRAPRWAVCLLWLLVAVRLVLPADLTPQSPVSLQAEEAPPQRIYHELQQQEDTYRATPPEQRTEEMHLAKAETPSTRYLPILWAIGVGCMILYMLPSYYRVWCKTVDAPRLFENVYRCDEYGTPFVMGIFAPCIYIPSTVSEEDMPQVLSHERCHIRRRDYLIKPLVFLLLSLHWFNPALWAAYILLGRDMERACDELALRHADDAQRAAYSRALVACAAAPRATAVCPLAFGEVAVKDRVKSILSHRQVTRGALFLLAAAALVIGALLLTRPIDTQDDTPYAWDAEELYPYVWTGALTQSVAEEAVYRLGAQTMASTYGYSDVLTRIHQEQAYTGVDIYFCLPEGETFTGVDTTFGMWMSGLCSMTNAMLPQAQWTRISVWDSAAGQARVIWRSADIHYGRMDLETLQTVTDWVQRGIDSGSVSTVETIDGVPSLFPPSPENDSPTADYNNTLPLWMQNNSVVYYDGALERTIEQGGDLTEEEIAGRPDIQGVGMYGEIPIEPYTKVEYDLHGFLQNIYYLNGFGEYQLAPLNARRADAIPRWMAAGSVISLDENMVMTIEQGSFLTPQEIETRQDIRQSGGIAVGALAGEANMRAEYGADGQIATLYRRNDNGSYTAVAPEDWPIYEFPTAGQ